MTHRNVVQASLVTCGAAALFIVFWLAFSGLPVHASSATVVLAEFRTRGSNGSSDEFIELYNVSGATVDIDNWRVMHATCTGGTSTVATILNRSTTLTDPGEKLNTTLILAQAPDGPVGSTYTWLDTEQPAVGAYYWLETIDLSGAAARTGPIAVVAPTGSA